MRSAVYRTAICADSRSASAERYSSRESPILNATWARPMALHPVPVHLRLPPGRRSHGDYQGRRTSCAPDLRSARRSGYLGPPHKRPRRVEHFGLSRRRAQVIELSRLVPCSEWWCGNRRFSPTSLVPRAGPLGLGRSRGSEAQRAVANTAPASSALSGGPMGLRSWDAATRASSSIGGKTGWLGTI